MSLPPLVCNTPPPPDQCEDDKDPEDFDINYNLSQDDDEDGFGFQTYSNYDVYEPSKSEAIQECHWPPTLNNTFENIITDNLNEENKKTEPVTPILNSLCEKLTLDDITVEDLNLVISQEEEVNTSIMNIEKIEEDASHSDIPSSDFVDNTDNKTAVDTDFDKTDFEIMQNETTDSPDISSLEVNNEHKYTKSQESDKAVEDFTNFSSNLDLKDEKTGVPQYVGESFADKVSESLNNEEETVDDFGDFDDFQFVTNGINASTYVETSENPWDHEIETNDFGDFKANFDENLIDNPNTDTSVAIASIEKSIHADIQMPGNDGDDDFGDFDDFKSCAKLTSQSEQDEYLQQHVPVLDFHSPDNETQILDSINNILSSIFSEEIEQESPEFVIKLESVLNETWGHLVDMDVRQPYMVNWNNSLGQKSLLKALCIDSRNILFGPKWNYNMPKYAVNLSAAPLQPQKQVTSPGTDPDIQNNHKSAIKESDTWTDPFSSNGQEFTYAEALLLDLEHLMATLDQMAHKHTTLKISELLSHACSNESETATTETRSNEMEVFEKVTPPKLDKVYPPPLSVQPLRQINLPDTHIFTPSDSETPRSKTIHYDSGPPVILSQAGVNDNGDPAPRTQSQTTINNAESDNDYWEFQDFKSTAEQVRSSAEEVVPVSEEPVSEAGTKSEDNIMPISVPYQPHILQPVKVETTAPTLNWPDPGEVKGSFDDFTDFVSSAPWENAEKDVRSVDSHESKINNIDLGTKDVNNSEISANIEINHDDEFETFQSAPIAFERNQEPRKNSNNDITYQPSTSKTVDFDSSLSDIGKFKTPNVISIANNVTVKNNSSYVFENHHSNVGQLRDGFITNSPIHSIETNILQPLPASSGTSGLSKPANTGQILQPLSLESYSHINWPNPGIDLQDLSRFNPVETLPSLKSEPSYGQSKVNSPAHSESTSIRNEIADDDIWGDFVSSKPATKKPPVFGDEDEWSEFVSSPSVKPQNGLNTISLNVHTNLNMQKSTHANKLSAKNNQISLDIPTLNYITPKANHKTYNDKHFQNL